MRDDPETKRSVHAPVALGPLALLLAPEFLHLLRRAIAEHHGRNREYMEASLFADFSLTLLVLVRVRIVTNDFVPSMHEIGKLSQILLDEARVRAQFFNTTPPVPQGGQLPFGFGSSLVQLDQVRPQTQLLECELVAEPRKRAFEISPRLREKFGVGRCPACEVPQYLLAQHFTSRTGAMAV